MTVRFHHFCLVGLALTLLMATGCNDYPTETTTRCHPNSEACKSFVSKDKKELREPDTDVGEQAFLSRCASCHGKDGRGDGKMDRGNFRDGQWHKKWSDNDLENIVTAGRGMRMPGQRMPRFELASLIKYIRTLKPPAPEKKGY
jgi:cytochrome c553